MLKNAPVWVALLLGTLLGMVTQFVLSRKENWIESLCVADQPGWTCFLGYTLGFSTFGLLCAALWSAFLFIQRNQQKKAKIEQDALQVFVEMISNFNKEVSAYLQPMEKRFFIETMQSIQQQQDVDIITHHNNCKYYRSKNSDRYNALSKTTPKINSLLTIIDVSTETEKSIGKFMSLVDDFFRYEIERNQLVAGDSILELTSRFVEIEEQKIMDHRVFGDKIGAAYEDFTKHLAQDRRYKIRPPR